MAQVDAIVKPMDAGMRKKKNKQKKFRVWFRQVNQSWVDVDALDQEDAVEKAYRKWRQNIAHSSHSYIEELEP